MPNIVALDSVHHRSLRVCTDAADGRGMGERFVQIVLSEFSAVALTMPILLSKDAETGSFYCGAMLGIDPGEDLFAPCADNRGQYRPLNLRRMPFFATDTGLAVDLDSRHIARAPHGKALFDEQGDADGYLKGVIVALGELRAGMAPTAAFVQAMLRHKLVEPIDIDLRFDDGTDRHLEGLYTISQDKLAALADNDVVDLFRSRHLQHAYHVVASLGQIRAVARRKNDRLAGTGEALSSAFG